MAIRDIILWPHSKLKEKSQEVVVIDGALRVLYKDLKDTVIAYGGLGLSGIQIGAALRVLVTNMGDEGPLIWVNPKIVMRSDEKVFDEEGCLSLPGIYEKVWRNKVVTVEARDEANQPVTRTVQDYYARLFQHEIDHFNGVVYPDRMDPGARDRIRRKLRKAA